MANSPVKEGLERGGWEAAGEFGLGAIATFILNWFLKKRDAKTNDSTQEISKALVETALQRDEDERARVMDDFAANGCNHLLEAQAERQSKVRRPYRTSKGKILDGKEGEPYEPGSERIMVNAFAVLRRAFHPNEYEPKKILDETTKKMVKNPNRLDPEEEKKLLDHYVERLGEMNLLPRYKLDARIEFMHDDRFKQFWERVDLRLKEFAYSIKKFRESSPALMRAHAQSMRETEEAKQYVARSKDPRFRHNIVKD